MWAGLLIIAKIIIKNNDGTQHVLPATAGFIYASIGSHLGVCKCEENISVKRVANCARNRQIFFLHFLYFEMVISHLWLDARPSNFDGRHSITPRFYTRKVTAQVRNKTFTLYNLLNSHLGHKRT